MKLVSERQWTCVFYETPPNTDVRLEVFTATELNKVFSSRQPLQMIYKIQNFGYQLHLHHES
jgi:hypothetical protein